MEPSNFLILNNNFVLTISGLNFQEDYMNLDTLESRLSNFLRRASMNNHNQQYPQLINSSPIGTMIPTPGMSHVPNSSMMVASSMDASIISASGCNSIVSASFNSVNMLPAGGTLGSSLNRFDGNIRCYHCSPILLHFFSCPSL